MPRIAPCFVEGGLDRLQNDGAARQPGQLVMHRVELEPRVAPEPLDPVGDRPVQGERTDLSAVQHLLSAAANRSSRKWLVVVIQNHDERSERRRRLEPSQLVDRLLGRGFEGEDDGIVRRHVHRRAHALDGAHDLIAASGRFGNAEPVQDVELRVAQLENPERTLSPPVVRCFGRPGRPAALVVRFVFVHGGAALSWSPWPNRSLHNSRWQAGVSRGLHADASLPCAAVHHGITVCVSICYDNYLWSDGRLGEIPRRCWNSQSLPDETRGGSRRRKECRRKGERFASVFSLTVEAFSR